MCGIAGLLTQRLLREVAVPLLPSGILQRPKQGFVVPLNSWLQGRFLPIFDDLCLGSGARVAGLLDRQGIVELRRRPLRDQLRHDLYALLVLEIWLRRLNSPEEGLL